MARQDPYPTGARQIGIAAVEVVGAVGAATGVVALLDEVAPVTGLGVLYVLAVMFVAVRRGQIAALITALLSVAVLNFFFIEPRYRLTIADSHNVVALGVFLIAALVVGRLAAAARRQATEAERRATLAMARERESAILADAASSLLAGRDLEAELANPGGDPANDGSARVGLTSAPEQREGELAVPLPASRPGWLYGRPDAGWDRSSLERLAEGLAGLIDVERERQRLALRSAEAEATRRADVAKTALLHAISHDLRSPLTAITTAASALRSTSATREDRRALIDASNRVRPARGLGWTTCSTCRESRLTRSTREPTGATSATSSRGPRRKRRRVASIRWSSTCRRSSPWCGRTRPSSSACSRTSSKTRSSSRRTAPRCGSAGGRGPAGSRSVSRTEGAGFPAPSERTIFEPFVRGHDDGQGSGLGLAICRGLVEANGGEIRLESTTGNETTFAVSFPLIRQPAETR